MMKSCWEEDPSARPSAEELDEKLKLFHVENVEPANARDTHHRTPVQSQSDFLYQVFPRHIANKLINGERVEPEAHECVTIFFSGKLELS